MQSPLTAGIPRKFLIRPRSSSRDSFSSTPLLPSIISTLSIPFASKEHATIAKRVISVDRELNQHLVERQLEVGDGGELRV